MSVGYDGTEFCGWQVQPNGRSVQGAIEAALAKIGLRDTAVIGAGRTDAGVHALGQVATFQTDSKIPLRAFDAGLNTNLPEDVRILRAAEWPRPLHARKDAREKVYDYYFIQGKTAQPVLSRYCWTIPAKVNLERAAAALAVVRGTHDFSSFCASGSDVEYKERIIEAASLSAVKTQHPLFANVDLYCIRLRGNGFLKQMVRNIVGSVLSSGEKQIDAQTMQDILAARDRRRAGPTAPAKGLFLMQVIY